MATKALKVAQRGICSKQVTAGVFETAGARGEDRMEDRHIISSPITEAEPGTHLLGNLVYPDDSHSRNRNMLCVSWGGIIPGRAC